jgi:hypothetical protein
MFDEDDNWIDDYDDDPVEEQEEQASPISIGEFEVLFGNATHDIFGIAESHTDPPSIEGVAVAETPSLPNATQIEQAVTTILRPPAIVQQTVGAAINHSHDPPSEVLTPQQGMVWGDDRFIAAMIGKKYQVVDLKHFDVVTQLYGMETYDLAQLAKFYSRYRVKIPSTDSVGNVTHMFKNVIEYWEAENKNRYLQVVFDPRNKLPSNIYNTFRGLAVTPKSGSWDLFRLHLLEVICNGNLEYYEC